MSKFRDVLNTFDLNNIPNLDLVVEGALELFSEVELPTLPEKPFKEPLVVGSGNAYHTARIIFPDYKYLADESSFISAFEYEGVAYDGVVLVSASGGKHALKMAEMAKNLPLLLLTHNPQTPLRDHLPADNILVFPKNREPYTYNTSTYLGLILSRTKEDVRGIVEHMSELQALWDGYQLSKYNAFVFIIPDTFSALSPMVRTKFDELFGGMVCGRVFTESEVMHAKTVVNSDSELFISAGVKNDWYGNPDARVEIPLPDQYNWALLMCALYLTVGRIQEAHPPYFADSIEGYAQIATNIFGHPISPIVE